MSLARVLHILLTLLLLTATSLALPPGAIEVQSTPINAYDLKVTEMGFKSGSFCTGTNVSFTIGASVSLSSSLDRQADTTYNYAYLSKLQLKCGDKQEILLWEDNTAFGQISGKVKGITLDSTAFPTSLEGTPLNIVGKGTFVLQKRDTQLSESGTFVWVIVAERTVEVELNVNLKVYNTFLANATNRNLLGTPNGWANSPGTLMPWGSVSPKMSSSANSLISNHERLEQINPDTNLEGGQYFHSKSQLIGSSGLLNKATVFFNSSHGFQSGVSDNSDPLATLTWQEIFDSTGHDKVSLVKPLALNIAILHSCLCASNASLDQLIFGSNIVDKAVLSFTENVFSTLKDGDNTPDIPYTDGSGPNSNIIMNDPLTVHVVALMNELNNGQTVVDALQNANDDHMPRGFAGSVNGINYCKALPMVHKGDPLTRLRTVYRGSDPSQYILIEDYCTVGVNP